jgi:carbon storage regulator
MDLRALPSLARKNPAAACLPAINQTAEEQLRQSGYLALRDISCHASDGVLTLRGSLPSHYLKQVAQEIVSRVEGVRNVVNRIEVRAPGIKRVWAKRPEPVVRFESVHNCIPCGEDAPARTRDRRKEFATMLVLSRKRNEAIIINGNVRIIVVDVRGNQVRLGIEAPDSVKILRQELCTTGVAGARLTEQASARLAKRDAVV